MTPAHLAPLIGGFLALLCLVGAFRHGRRRWLVENLPTSKTGGVFIGLVELKGTAEVHGPPLCSYLSHQPCFHYHWRVEEKYARIVFEDGKIKRETGWETVAKGGDLTPFLLRDDRGSILIRPEGAKIEPVVMLDRECKRNDPLYHGKGPAKAIKDSKHRRRFYEAGIPVRQPLYVMGTARERKDLVAPEIAHDPQAHMFLISARTEDEVRRRFRGKRLKWLAGGGVWLLAGFLIRDMALEQHPSGTWPQYVAGLVGYAGAASLAWAWMIYNGLMDLRNRVRRAWAEVDVQLKRRHELIPRLVEVISRHASQERDVTAAVTELRGQMQATPPGVAGPDSHAVGASMIALAERHPELVSHELFVTLQRSLAETEERIALARGFFNEIATHYNTRLEVVPERWVARLARLTPRTLMTADGFDRGTGVGERPQAAGSLVTRTTEFVVPA